MAALGLSCSMQGLRASVKHMESLVVACKLLTVACGVSFPDQGWDPDPLHWEDGILATGPPPGHTICGLTVV